MQNIENIATYQKNSEGELWQKELELVKVLRKNCDENGKETDVTKSAKIFHKLALIYKQRSPEKFSLIRSAALLNAAIVRKPSNIEKIRGDLKNVYHHLFTIGNATHTDFNSCRFVELVRKKFKRLRMRTRKTLESLRPTDYSMTEEKHHQLKKQRIQTMEELQVDIAEEYVSIMRRISDKCIAVMGKAPCRYSVAAMGSIARKEATPYSDFEHVILLEDKSLLDFDVDSHEYQNTTEYFRWYSVLFQFIIIGLGETIIPSVCIPSLNDNQNKDMNWFYDAHTPRGISFDGMMVYASKFPLGRQEKTKNKPWTTELIQPVTKMVEYLDTDVDLKNGYHLGDILTKTLFVSGYIKIYSSFSKLVKKTLSKNLKTNQDVNLVVRKQIENDLANFNTFRDAATCNNKTFQLFVQMKTPDKFDALFNIKRIVFRSITLFIAAMGNLHGVCDPEFSGYDIIRSLRKHEVIDSDFADKLLYALSLACEVRVKIYCNKGCQDDVIKENEYHSKPANNVLVQALVENIGGRATIDFFTTCWELQETVRGNNSELTKDLVSQTRFHLGYKLGLFKEITCEWKCFEGNELENKINFFLPLIPSAFMNLKKYEDALSVSLQFIKQLDGNSRILLGFATLICLINLRKEDDEIFAIVTAALKHLSWNQNPWKLPMELLDNDIFSNLLQDDLFSKQLYRETQDDDFFHDDLSLFRQKFPRQQDFNKLFSPMHTVLIQTMKAASLCYISECLMKMNYFEQALKIADASFSVYKMNPEAGGPKRLGHVWYIMGKCCFKRKHLLSSKLWLSKALTELETYVDDWIVADQCTDIKQLLAEISTIIPVSATH
ncbi:uncharacterized protein LOC143451637 [Clavelina lepadiformis]|uniref:uncharacterized protein LOC143451637 n=1 Tax=Clavelina lepadiformis TaxID=159417 RepID=UPI0040424356